MRADLVQIVQRLREIEGGGDLTMDDQPRPPSEMGLALAGLRRVSIHLDSQESCKPRKGFGALAAKPGGQSRVLRFPVLGCSA